jgi:ankyrin repeat protein
VGHDDEVAFLLARGADPNIETYGETPLTKAEMQGRADIATFLRQTGAVG